MVYAKYELTNDPRIPAIVSLEEKRTPVWIQQLWDEGEYQLYVRKNGCGHCCCAMALNLYGYNLNPHDEYSLCRELWGEPSREERDQGNFQSITGIIKILRHFGVPAEAYGVPDSHKAIKHIKNELLSGKQVIFESHPTKEFPDNPFSTGEHWVMAIGYSEGGDILVANTSLRATDTGIQLVDEETIRRALYLGSEPIDMTWGEWKNDFKNGTGYIIVG